MYIPLALSGGLPQHAAHNPNLATGVTNPFIPAPAGSPAATAGAQAGENSFFNTIGNVIAGAAQTASDFGTSLLQLRLFERANQVAAQTGQQVNANGTAANNAAAANAAAGGQRGFFSGLPVWFAPAAFVSIAAILLYLVFRPRAA